MDASKENNFKPTAVIVYLNSIEIGRLPTKEFEEIRAEGRADKRLWVVQAAGVLHASWNCICEVVKQAAMVMALLPLLLGLCAPEEISTVLTEMMRSPEAVNQAARTIFHLVLTVAFVGVSFNLATGRSFGFDDAFAQDLTKRLRMRFEVPADGAVYWRFASEPTQER